ncbi:MAG: hypothetical protein HY353_01010 [Candidatus Omnitrophica bacterium]|nr:hypothetical protein [Candidatus Omnitrophota bacterium]
MSTQRPLTLEAEPARYLWLIVLVLGLIGLTIVLMTAPAQELLGQSAEAIRGALHGTAAGLFMVTATIGLFQGYRLFAGQARSVAELQVGSVVNAALAFFTIALGNWVYIPYRVSGGPRSYFLEHAPEIHKVFFEFKEFAALFTLPLAAAAAFILIFYGASAVRRKDLSTLVAVLLALVFFYFLVAFGLGAAVTKLKSV